MTISRASVGTLMWLLIAGSAGGQLVCEIVIRSEESVGTIRPLHGVNDGWANGFRHNIRYWEIWNEPENRPTMWTGDDEDYYRMYAAAAKTIKAGFPDIRIGGPVVGFAGVMNGKRLEPTAFVRGFLDRCQRESLPLDFFSWHTYTNNPWELQDRALAVRQLLDESGFKGVENHLNEWNYLPDDDWTPMMVQDPRGRQAWFARLNGHEGAAFTAASLILFQDASLDAANFCSAATHGFGMFSEHGVPYKNFYAIKAFKELLTTPLRLPVEGELPAGVALMAGTNKQHSQYNVLASNTTMRPQQLKVRLSNPGNERFTCRILRVDADRDLVADETTQQLPLTLHLPVSSVALIRVERSDGNAVGARTQEQSAGVPSELQPAEPLPQQLFTFNTDMATAIMFCGFGYDSPQFEDAVRQLRPQGLRFPGGTLANNYVCSKDSFSEPTNDKTGWAAEHLKLFRKIGRPYELPGFAPIVRLTIDCTPDRKLVVST